MRILLLFFILSLVITETNPVYSQIPKSKTWDICLHGGLLLPNTDISDNQKDAQMGLGISVTKFILPFLALQEQFLIGKLKGEERTTGNNSKYNFETDINYSASLHALFQVGNVGFLKRVPNMAFYAYGGIGFINFTPHVFRYGSSDSHNYYVQNNLIDSTVDYSKTTELMFPLAAGIKYRVFKRMSLHLEYSLRLIDSDKLDGWYHLNSGNDKFSYTNIGLTIHIGRITKRDQEAD